MKLNLNFEYDKLHLKEIVILIPKYHQNMVSFLTPVLGLYGINVKEFINEFNNKTRFIKFDIIVPTRVKISKIKTFEISIKTPYISSIISNLPAFSTYSKLNLLSIYKISLIKSVFNNFFMAPFQKKIYYSLRQYLSVISNTNSSIKLKSFYISTINQFNLSYFFNFKSWSKILQISNLIKGLPYGAFVTFNSVTCSRINYLTNSLALLGLTIIKTPSSFFSVFLSNTRLYGDIYYIGACHFAKFIYFYNTLLSRNTNPGFFVSYFKFNRNLFSLNFLQLFVRTYLKFSTPLVLVKMVYLLNINIIKLLHKNSLKIIHLLKKHYANLSSNIT
jgi:hypothetical protein